MAATLTPLGKKVLISIFFILAVGAAASPSVYFYLQNQNLKKSLENQPEPIIDEAKALVDKIGKYIDLPADEIPTIATITEVEKLKDQKFFAKAKNGDKVLIYTNAQKAFLYDPVSQKVLEVGPLTFPTPTLPADLSSEASAKEEASTKEGPISPKTDDREPITDFPQLSPTPPEEEEEEEENVPSPT